MKPTRKAIRKYLREVERVKNNIPLNKNCKYKYPHFISFKDIKL